MEFEKIQKTSDQVKNTIKQLSAYSLPNNPSERGMTPEQIKKRFYDPILGSAASALSEIDRLVGEINGVVTAIGQAIANLSETSTIAKQTSERAETSASEAANAAESAETAASEAADRAEGAAEDAEAAEIAASEIKNAILGMEIITETADAGMPASAQAEIVDGKMILTLTIPRGVQGAPGIRGERGEGFDIDKVYASVEEMEKGFETDGLPEGSFVLVRPADETAEDYGKLYIKGASAYLFEVDMSVAVKGDKGDPGYTPVYGVDYWTQEHQSAMAEAISLEISKQLGVVENGSY